MGCSAGRFAAGSNGLWAETISVGGREVGLTRPGLQMCSQLGSHFPIFSKYLSLYKISCFCYSKQFTNKITPFLI